MDNFEIKHILESFEIIIDTREQPTKRAFERYESFGCPYKRQTLNYADYTYNVRINDRPLFLPDIRVNGLCAIERKQNLDELAMCLTRSRDRFEREFLRASEKQAKIFLLVENASWDMIYDGQYRSRFKPKAFIASLAAWQVRYNLNVVFCEARHSGFLIREILYRDIKERLERGEFDGTEK